MTCKCGRAAETGQQFQGKWLTAGCRNCGIYVTGHTQLDLETSWNRRQQSNSMNAQDAKWWEWSID